jgi:hypothetical protein
MVLTRRASDAVTLSPLSTRRCETGCKIREGILYRRQWLRLGRASASVCPPHVAEPRALLRECDTSRSVLASSCRTALLVSDARYCVEPLRSPRRRCACPVTMRRWNDVLRILLSSADSTSACCHQRRQPTPPPHHCEPKSYVLLKLFTK